LQKLPSITIKELIEAGVHFGHKTMRWNPKMSTYIYGVRDDIHIIDLQQTLPLLVAALGKIYDVAKNNGRVLFVGTKMQASEIVAEAAKRCGQYYVNHRWLGGMLTNWSTINRSIKKLSELEALISEEEANGDNNEQLKLTKKEKLDITRKIDKLEKSLGGIREMGGVPDILFVIDTNKEDIAIQEAKKLNIPVIAIVDSNSDPDDVDMPIPGNDDATRAIRLYCRLVSDSVLYGMQESLAASGIDLGEAADISQVLELNANLENAGEIKKKDMKKKVTKAPAEKIAVKEVKAEVVVEKKVVKKDVAKDVASEEPTKTKAKTTKAKATKE